MEVNDNLSISPPKYADLVKLHVNVPPRLRMHWFSYTIRMDRQLRTHLLRKDQPVNLYRYGHFLKQQGWIDQSTGQTWTSTTQKGKYALTAFDIWTWTDATYPWLKSWIAPCKNMTSPIIATTCANSKYRNISPPSSFTTSQKESVTSSSLQGKWLFWSSWRRYSKA